MRQDSGFIHAAGFMSSGYCVMSALFSSLLSLGCFSFYVPKLYIHYEDNLKALLEGDPQLSKPFEGSMFLTFTFNCGTCIVTLEHVDSTNVPYGFCPIFACGSYNHHGWTSHPLQPWVGDSVFPWFHHSCSFWDHTSWKYRHTVREGSLLHSIVQMNYFAGSPMGSRRSRQ